MRDGVHWLVRQPVISNFLVLRIGPEFCPPWAQRRPGVGMRKLRDPTTRWHLAGCTFKLARPDRAQKPGRSESVPSACGPTHRVAQERPGSVKLPGSPHPPSALAGPPSRIGITHMAQTYLFV